MAEEKDLIEENEIEDIDGAEEEPSFIQQAAEFAGNTMSGINEDMREGFKTTFEDMKSSAMMGLDKVNDQLEQYDQLMHEAEMQRTMADQFRDLEEDMINGMHYDNMHNPDFDLNDRMKVLEGRKNTHDEDGTYNPNRDYDPTTDPAFTGVDEDKSPVRITKDGDIQSKEKEDPLADLSNSKTDPNDLSKKINDADQAELAEGPEFQSLKDKLDHEKKEAAKGLTQKGLEAIEKGADKLHELSNGKIDIDPNQSRLFRIAAHESGLNEKRRQAKKEEELKNRKPTEEQKFFSDQDKVEKALEEGAKRPKRKDPSTAPKIGAEGLTESQAESIKDIRQAAEAAEAAADAAAGAATAGLYTAAKHAVRAGMRVVDKAVDITTGGMSENLSSRTKCGIMVCGCILVPIGMVALPFVLIGMFFTVLFSNLLGVDGIKQNRAVAESSFVYKEANARTGFKVSDVVSTPSEDVFEVVWDAKIYNKNKRKSYDKQREAMKKSDNFGKPIWVYADPEESVKLHEVRVEESVVGYNGKKSYEGDYLKIKFPVYADHPMIEDGTLETDHEEYVDRDYETEDLINDTEDSTVKEDKPRIYAYGYIRKNNVIYMPTSDPFFEYHPEDEYKILSNALKIVLQERHSESMSYVVNQISKHLDSKKYNQFNMELREIEDEEEVIYVNGSKNNVIDPEAPEFNSGKSMASIQDMGANGEIMDGDVAKALAAYVTSKAEKAPEDGYFSEFDKAFYSFINDQFQAHIGSMQYEEKTRKVKTADLVEKEVLIDSEGKGLMLPKEVAESEENQWGIDAEKDTADYVLVNTEAYVENEEYREDSVIPKTRGYKKVKKGTGDYFLITGDKYDDQTFNLKKKGKIKVVENIRDEEYEFKEYYLPTSIDPFEIEKLLDKLFKQSKHYDAKNFEEAKDLPYYQYETQYEYDNKNIEVQLENGETIKVKAKDIEKYRKEMNAYLLENGINTEGLYQGTFYITDKEFDTLITVYNDVYKEGRKKIEPDEVDEAGWLYLMRVGLIDDDGNTIGGIWEYEEPLEVADFIEDVIVEDLTLSEDEIDEMDDEEVGEYINEITDEEIDTDDKEVVALKRKEIKDFEDFRKREIKLYLSNRKKGSFLDKVKDNSESSDSWTLGGALKDALESTKDFLSKTGSIIGNTVKNIAKGEDNPYDKAVEDTDKSIKESEERALNNAIGNDEGVHPVGGERIYYQEELVCQSFGVDFESNCGAEPKVGKIPILTKLGPVQKYKISDQPLLYTTSYRDEETETPIDVEVAFTVESRINFIEDNMYELLEEVVGGRGSGINGVAGEDIVAIARNEIGNIGGKEYQMWFYGVNSVQGIPSHAGPNQTMWCAIFVSWAAEQLGLIDSGVVPKHAGVVGFIDFYRAKGAWHPAGSYIPEVGDFVVYDFENDGRVDHIEIVSEVTDSGFYSIGGNTIGGPVSDAPPGIVWEHARMRSFNEPMVYGFAKPDYPEFGADLSSSIEKYIKPSHQASAGFIEKLGKSVIAGAYEFGDNRLAKVIGSARSKDVGSYNKLKSEYDKAVVEEFEDKFGITSGKIKPNPSEEAMNLASELLASKAGAEAQREIIQKDIQKYLKQVEKMDKKSKLNGKAKALIVGEAVKYKNTFNMDFLDNTDVAKAIQRSIELEGTLPSVRSELEGLKADKLTTKKAPFNKDLFSGSNVKKHMDKLFKEDVNRLISMDENLFAEDIVGDLPPNGSYLNGKGQPAKLCKMDSRATRMKTYMDYKAITATASQQWHLQNTVVAGQRAKTDPKTGIRMWGGRYIIAVAPTYGTIGTQLDITIGGKKIKAIVGDTKAENTTCQHYDGSFVEFVVDTPKVPQQVKVHGSFNELPQFSGPIENVVFVGRIPVPSSW